MLKLRSMIKGADQSGVDSTAATDSRITQLGTLSVVSSSMSFPNFGMSCSVI